MLSYVALYGNNTITYSQFALYYDDNYKKYKDKEHPEWAWNTDNWKEKRNNIAKEVIELFNKKKQDKKK